MTSHAATPERPQPYFSLAEVMASFLYNTYAVSGQAGCPLPDFYQLTGETRERWRAVGQAAIELCDSAHSH